MSSRGVVTHFGSEPSYASMMECVEKVGDKYDSVRTFFNKFRNPIGIEVEVEGYRAMELHPRYDYWKTVPDGSLKVNGIEFVSVPLASRHIDYAIHELAEHLKTQKLLWSHRTSIHVHVNMSTLKMNHLTALVAVYGLFEDLYFSMVDPIRKANPYCYPATLVDPQVYMKVAQENKYCALNLAPLQTQGTIEFRHLQGTEDWRLVRRWIQMIVKLHYFIEQIDSKDVVPFITNMVEQRDFKALFKAIYGASATLFPEEIVELSTNNNALWAITILTEGFD